VNAERAVYPNMGGEKGLSAVLIEPVNLKPGKVVVLVTTVAHTR